MSEEKEMYLIFHPEESRYVAFTDRVTANLYGKSFNNIQSFVVTVDPPIPLRYQVRFTFDREGFREVSIVRRFYEQASTTIILFLLNAQIINVWVTDYSDTQAILSAKTALMNDIKDLKDGVKNEFD